LLAEIAFAPEIRQVAIYSPQTVVDLPSRSDRLGSSKQRDSALFQENPCFSEV